MQVRARELWTGDVVLLQGKIVTKMQRIAEGDLIKITMADIVPARGDPPIEVVNEKEISYRPAEYVTVMRGTPLFNGMHMTQLDIDGNCHGHAHPQLERKLRNEGRIAPDYAHS